VLRNGKKILIDKNYRGEKSVNLLSIKKIIFILYVILLNVF